MAANQVTLTGWKEFEGKADNLAKQFPEEIDEAAKFGAQSWVRLASISAPVDQGRLRQRISPEKVSTGVWNVNSPSEYSAVMEWGSKKLISVPAELQEYAIQFKGVPHGTGAKEAIYAWAKRVGIKNPYLVFRKIMMVGVKPHPFFFIHKQTVEAQIIRDIKQMIKER